MKRLISTTGIFLLILTMLDESGILDALLAFLLVGAIPGTSWSLPAGLMFAICSAAIAGFVFRYTAITLINEFIIRRLTRRHINRKERMPKKRFQPLPR